MQLAVAGLHNPQTAVHSCCACLLGLFAAYLLLHHQVGAVRRKSRKHNRTFLSCAQEDGEIDDDDESGWETASDEDEEAHFDAAAAVGADTPAAREASSAQDTTQVHIWNRQESLACIAPASSWR